MQGNSKVTFGATDDGQPTALITPAGSDGKHPTVIDTSNLSEDEFFMLVNFVKGWQEKRADSNSAQEAPAMETKESIEKQ